MLNTIAMTSETEACSLSSKANLQAQYEAHALVFLGTIQAPASGKHRYDITVDEVFKGPPTRVSAGSKVSVTLGVGQQCGFGVPARGARALIFMNGTETILTTSGSRILWSEAEQSKPAVNPVWDDIIVLRRMLRLPAVPDQDSALHLALKVLLPIYGQAVVSQQWPFKAEFFAEAATSDERVWRVTSTEACVPGSAVCPPDVEVRINRWTGNVLRVISDG